MPRKMILLWCLSLAALTVRSQTVHIRVLKDSLFIPWEIIYGPDNHLWFTQKNGYVCRMDTAGKRTDTLLYEPTTATIKESGMLGMALHPGFDLYPYVYVAWEYVLPADGSIKERIVRYNYDEAANKLVAPYILLDSIRGAKYHNGCRLQISDGMLYCTIADAADSANAQDLSNINGKVLRINLDGTIPAGNPIPGSPIWSWGHRNAQGLLLANGILYSTEHGPDTDDEVNIITRGGNYGWPFARGYCDKPWEAAFCADSGVVAPLYAWTPTIAVCGLDYYDHPMFPSFRNSLLMATLKDKHLYSLTLSDDHLAVKGVSVIPGVNFGRLRDLCVSPEGKIYITTSNSNADGIGPRIDRIVEITNPAISTRMQDLLLYPNPARDHVYLVPPISIPHMDYLLSDAAGRLVQKGSITPLKPRIFLDQLPMGIYQVSLYENGKLLYQLSFTHLP